MSEPLDPYVANVIQQLHERAAVGLKKYGVTTADAGLSLIDWLRHAQEEALDMAVYLEAAINPLFQSPNSDQDKWCPDECPITGLPFFMWITTPEGVEFPTYGGPRDSYTIPEMSGRTDRPRHERALYRARCDHDLGEWTYTEEISLRIIEEDVLYRLTQQRDDLLEAAKQAVEIIKDSWGEDQIESGDDQACNLLIDAIAKGEGRAG